MNYCGPAINCNGLFITKLNFKVNYKTKSGLMQKVRNRLMMGTEKYKQSRSRNWAKNQNFDFSHIVAANKWFCEKPKPLVRS